MLADRLLQSGRHRGVIAVGAAEGFRHDLVDDAQRQEILGGHFQRVGGVVGLVRVLPKDRRASLRADHRIDRVLQHQDAVRHAQGERASAAAFADHHRDDGHGQPRHQAEAGRDGFRFAPLLPPPPPPPAGGAGPPRPLGGGRPAMASDWPRSSAPRPGYAPGVSMNVMTGRPKRSARSMRRWAFRYPSGWGIPKLRLTRSLTLRPFWWPMTTTGAPSSRPIPPTIAASSANARSPSNSRKSGTT